MPEGSEPVTPRDAEANADVSPPRPHTRMQRFYRFLFRFYGPAQVGPPPYATPEEVRRWEESRRPTAATPPVASQAPPGYRVVRYTDEAGTVHHSIVRDGEPETPGARE